MSDVASKWGEAVAGRGFSQIPNYLLLLNQFLDEESRLSPIELLILFQLTGAWWEKNKQPFPSMKTLAARCGASERQVQRSINNLIKRDLLARVKRRSKGIISSNAYDLLPLVSFLETVSKAFPNGYPRRIDKLIKTARIEASLDQAAKDTLTVTEAVAAHIDAQAQTIQAQSGALRSLEAALGDAIVAARNDEHGTIEEAFEEAEKIDSGDRRADREKLGKWLGGR